MSMPRMSMPRMPMPHMPMPLDIWLLNPYHSGSHQAWAEGYAAHSRHRVRILSMAGHFWKWRMQGGTLELAEQATAAGREPPDLLLASSMVNLPAFLGLTRRRLGNVPVVLYMHENQLTYPPPPGSKRDLTYGMIQHLSMLAADRVCFNSRYHLESWFEELPRLLKHFPDYTHLETVRVARTRSLVLPVGCDLRRYDRFEPLKEEVPRESSGPPLILWNQRWEYDKDPGTFFKALYDLAGEGSEFRLALAGENFRVVPGEFAEAQARLGNRLVHYGYAAGLAEYGRLLWESDLVVSTALHEFFGVSILEAVYCGCRPVLPRRLSYPELIPAEMHSSCLYDDYAGLMALLRAGLRAPARLSGLREAAAHFDWEFQAPAYDDLLEDVVREK
jgi:glycosyltransferase involved in cell wall biosynthesis